MTLESAIKHCIEVAEIQEVTARVSGGESLQVKECLECASEYRQLAEWLRELQRYRKGIEEIREQINNYKGCDMWDTANGMEFALELMEVNADDFCDDCASEHRQLAEWLRELKAYRDMQPLYLWYPLRKKVPEQYRHVIAILRCGSEVEVYLAHEMWHIVDGARTKFEDVVFWRYMEVNADDSSRTD